MIKIDIIKQGRSNFTKEEWMDVLIRSMGIEPSKIKYEQKWHFIERAVPLVENNYNLCELGPRGTGKSHIYKEISPNSILVSGGQTTVANLFYNMSQKKIGLVGMWDCVAFDEVAGITFKDKDGIQIMKDYMASGSFARGKEEEIVKEIKKEEKPAKVEQKEEILLKNDGINSDSTWYEVSKEDLPLVKKDPHNDTDFHFCVYVYPNNSHRFALIIETIYLR